MSHLPKPSIENYRDFKDHPKIASAVARILARQRFVAPVEVFVELGLLLPEDLKRWKQGQVPRLKRVIRCNLTRAGRILRLLRFHVHELNLKPSITPTMFQGICIEPAYRNTSNARFATSSRVTINTHAPAPARLPQSVLHHRSRNPDDHRAQRNPQKAVPRPAQK